MIDPPPFSDILLQRAQLSQTEAGDPLPKMSATFPVPMVDVALRLRHPYRAAAAQMCSPITASGAGGLSRARHQMRSETLQMVGEALEKENDVLESDLKHLREWFEKLEVYNRDLLAQLRVMQDSQVAALAAESKRALSVAFPEKVRLRCGGVVHAIPPNAALLSPFLVVFVGARSSVARAARLEPCPACRWESDEALRFRLFGNGISTLIPHVQLVSVLNLQNCVRSLSEAVGECKLEASILWR